MPPKAPSSGSRCNVDQPLPFSILLVDDDEYACEILRSMLAKKYPHASIHSAENGNIGLECVRRYQPDIVISDINMPEMDGVRMLVSISEIRPDTRVIVVTAHSDSQNLERITSTGINIEFVFKPIDFAALFNAINRCIPH